MKFGMVKMLVQSIYLPTFVAKVEAMDHGFCWTYAKRQYGLFVTLKDHQDGFGAPGWPRRPLSNHAFDLPKDERELRLQVVTACTMALAHELLEFSSEGGAKLWNLHKFKGGSTEDTAQWLELDDDLFNVLNVYTQKMSI